MTPQTNTLMSVAGQTGALTGAWFNTSRFHGGQTHVPLKVDITAGTATVVLEGTNDIINGAAVTINTLSASDAFLSERFAFIRARLSGATGATVRVSSDKPLKQAS
jgi:hypothetical protein